MNANSFRYLSEDIRSGLSRNKGASIAAAALVFAAILLVGFILFIRLALQDAAGYVQSQMTMKVYIDPAYDTEEMAAVLKDNRYIASAEIETSEELLGRLEMFFTGREQLLDSFKDDAIHDAIKLYTKDPEMLAELAESLGNMDGIEQAVYPQQMAEMLDSWLKKTEYYGAALSVFFFGLAFMMVYMAFHLAHYQRRKEIRIRLLIGEDPRLVKLQFILEGAVIGLAGSLPAAAAVYGLYMSVLLPAGRAVPFLFQFSSSLAVSISLLQMALGLMIGIGASWLAVRKLIRHV